MKLKLLVAGAILAASFGASATTRDLGTLDSTSPDTFQGFSSKFADGALISDLWIFHLDVPSSTSFGALQTISAPNHGIKDFSAVLLGVPGSTFQLSTSADGTSQTLSWGGHLGAGDYTVKVTGKSQLKNSSYGVTVAALPVPEPETYGMMLGGLALVGVAARRKAKKAA